MSCYITHLIRILDEMGVEVTRYNRRDIDLTIKRIVGTEGEGCPVTWKAVREAMARDKEGFLESLRNAAREQGW